MHDLLKKTRLYTFLFFVGVVLLTILVVFLPLEMQLEDTLVSNWVLTAQSRSLSFHLFLEKSMEGAQSVSSRSVIRDQLAEYHQQELTWEDLQASTQPKYVEGVRVLENLAYAYRVVEGKILAAYRAADASSTVDEAFVFLEDIPEFAVLNQDGQQYVVVSSEVKKENHCLGKDVLIYSLDPILEQLNDAEIQVSIISEADLAPFLNLPALRSGKDYRVVKEGGNLHYLECLQDSQHYLNIQTPLKQIVGPTRQGIGFFLVLYLLGQMLLFLLARRGILKYAHLMINQVEKSKEEFRVFAYHDTLTGSYSRLSLEHWLERLAKTGNKKTMTVVMLDIDMFKDINDTYGHKTGDEVLIALSKTVHRCIRKDDLLVRYGGDEFLIIFQETDRAWVTEIMARIEQQLVQDHSFKFPIEISYGIVEINDINHFYDDLKQADKQMYAHKNGKK
ncbi:MAG: GGDEF domain-containing protein [Chloroflexi bacterium]|nr:GGDEF domain-containing protein [Chloroflexota bacterium]